MAGASVTRLVPIRERYTRAEVRSVREALMALPDGALRPAVLAMTLNDLDRRVEPDSEVSIWPGGFVMISREQTAAVWKAIDALPAKDRRQQVHHAFRLVLLNLRPSTGEVDLFRDQFADEMGCSPNHVSAAMSVLERLGVIVRSRRRLEGMRGPGVVVYSINPHVGWNGNLDARRERAGEHAPPLLQLMQGGKAGG